jgi:phosphatidylserine decarboxylase
MTPQERVTHFEISITMAEKNMALYRKRYRADLSKANARQRHHYANLGEALCLYKRGLQKANVDLLETTL